jgi:hypothetical protein
MKTLLTAILLFSISSCALTQSANPAKYNLDMEQLTPAKDKALGWATYFQVAQSKAYPVKVDSVVKQHGKYSMSIEKVADGAQFGVVDYPIKKTFSGTTIQLRGYLKTQGVASFAGLWMRVDGADGILAFDNMQSRPVKGTTDWTEYVIDLNYDAQKAVTIHAGALLQGEGKIWLDNVKILIDGKSIDSLQPITRQLSIIERDTVFNSGSKITNIKMSSQQVINLNALGQVWGFLKYHLPAVGQGKFNWDAELFRIMPSVIKAENNKELSTALEKWIDSLGTPPLCKNCATHTDSAVKITPDYGLLFNNKVLSPSLTEKLTFILDNRDTTGGFYITKAPNGNPAFLNEAPYTNMVYPDAGYRLLCLYRYWNMIQYFYPYKYLIGEDWDEVLKDCIPKFVTSANATDYVLNTLALIARVNDTHANIWSNNETLTAYYGSFGTPFQAKFIENKLVVTAYYNDTLNVKQLVKPGDIIETINGTAVSDMVKKYLPYTPASNYATQLRDLPRRFLLRANVADFKLNIVRDGKLADITVKGLPYSTINYRIEYDPDPKSPGYYLINKNIGYVFPGRYKNDDLPKIETLFAGTKGIIIDMRCYPSEFMPFTFVPYIKADKSAFVKFTQLSLATPGLFSFSSPLQTPSLNKYKGKVIVIVNAVTQSQAEYTTMAFQSSPNVTVIGSQTAGADGDVSRIMLPGGISTMISGLGVYYPDGITTQRAGVKINLVIKPTIQGIKTGKDELLDKAKELIMDN